MSSRTTSEYVHELTIDICQFQANMGKMLKIVEEQSGEIRNLKKQIEEMNKVIEEMDGRVRDVEGACFESSSY